MCVVRHGTKHPVAWQNVARVLHLEGRETLKKRKTGSSNETRLFTVRIPNFGYESGRSIFLLLLPPRLRDSLL
jgi:hypothetical protein